MAINEEHKEAGKDFINVVISYTPLSGIIDTIRFIHKWLFKKQAGQRIAKHIESRIRK
jgi:hypothetical protein